MFNNALYVGGNFSQTADGSVTNLNRIAKFDGSAWSALPGNGLSSTVNALAVFNNALYVGGNFTQTADASVTNLNRIAKFDGSAWSGLPNNGLSDNVYALAVFNNALYVGGFFTQTADGSVTNLNRIAKFNGSAWSALPNNGLSDNVYALAVFNNALYVGGFFTQTADGSVTNLNRIAKFNGSAWSALPGNGLSSTVNALAVFNNALYVGGLFSQTADGSVTNLNRIAKFDGSAWSALPGNGLSSYVNALAVFNNALYVGGNFTQTADASVTNLNYIAKLSFTPTQTGPTFAVNTAADTDDGLCDVAGQGNFNQDCTLREAINAANANGGFDVIHFAADYTITLTSTLPTISDDVTLDGETHKVTLDGNASYRILTYNSDGSGYIDHLTFANTEANPGLAFGNSGGAIYSESASGIDIRNSAFKNNYAGAYGGAIFSNGTVIINNSTFSGNGSDLGGAVTAHNLTVRNSTFSGNTAPNGAGLYAGGTLTLKNSILANSTGPDCSLGGTVSSAINNLIESTGSDACGLTDGVNGNKIGIDPSLGDYEYYGGVTKSFALNPGSPAMDAGDNATCAADPINNTDQRGGARPTDGDGNYTATCDIGSYEAATFTSCIAKPTKPTLKKPKNGATVTTGKVKFKWARPSCTLDYQIIVKNATTGQTVFKKMVTGTGARTTNVLPAGSYKWFVKARNAIGATKSTKFTFTK